MKKLILSLAVLIIFLMSCANPAGETDTGNPPIAVLTFEEAVQEMYQIVGSRIFYSSDGVNLTGSNNRATSPNEVPGVCITYAVYFVYLWNEVKNYDEIYGKAYLLETSDDGLTFKINDLKFVYPLNDNLLTQGWDPPGYSNLAGKYFYEKTVHSGGRFLHFNQYISDHGSPVININGEWWDTEPTGWDTSTALYDYVPYKLNI